MHIHLIGIGGTGLSAIATVLHERGVEVSGSDRQESALTRRLEQTGVRITIGHRVENVAGADLVVRSSAIATDNVEVQAAQAAGIPVKRREEFLSQLIGPQRAIAVAGTHGKTTTTSMIAWMLASLDRDPSFVIGGTPIGLGVNAHAGMGEHFVIEADEYDGMFLGLQPEVTVVTNVEYDHPDCYPTVEAYRQAFADFVSQTQPGGLLVACGDDPGAAALAAILPGGRGRSLTYGLKPGNDLQAVDIQPNSRGGFTFDVLYGGRLIATRVAFQAPGLHNVSNGLAALAVGMQVGLVINDAARVLEGFQGTGRRFEVRGEKGGVILVDDYAHHPTEIRATLEAARARYPERRLWAVWQPHTYSRLQALFAEFAAAFDAADCVLVTEVFGAREAPPAPEAGGRPVSVNGFVEALGSRRGAAGGCVYGPVNLDQAQAWLMESLRPGDVTLVLSAGDADRITTGLLQALPEWDGKSWSDRPHMQEKENA